MALRDFIANWKRVFGVILALTVAWPPVAAQSRPGICPAFYNFNALRGVSISIPPYLIRAGIPNDYTPEFLYQWGTETFGDVGRIGFANYNFSSITSEDGKVLLSSPWILGNCFDVATVHAPGDTTWQSLMIVGNNGGNPEWLISTEDVEETCGGGGDTDRIPLDAAAIGPQPSTQGAKAPGAPLFVCDYGGGSGGGGGGGGGGTITVDCLYIDYYDGDGTFLYSVEVACWQI